MLGNGDGTGKFFLTNNKFECPIPSSLRATIGSCYYSEARQASLDETIMLAIMQDEMEKVTLDRVEPSEGSVLMSHEVSLVLDAKDAQNNPFGLGAFNDYQEFQFMMLEESYAELKELINAIEKPLEKVNFLETLDIMKQGKVTPSSISVVDGTTRVNFTLPVTDVAITSDKTVYFYMFHAQNRLNPLHRQYWQPFGNGKPFTYKKPEACTKFTKSNYDPMIYNTTAEMLPCNSSNKQFINVTFSVRYYNETEKLLLPEFYRNLNFDAYEACTPDPEQKILTCQHVQGGSTEERIIALVAIFCGWINLMIFIGVILKRNTKMMAR